MKKYSLLVFLILFLIGCSTEEITEEPLDVEESVATETTENIEPIQINEDILWTKGVGKSPEEFISNWNKLINSISNDEETIMFFSINPDGVNWVSDAKQTLVYQFGKSTAKENIFVLNLNVDNDTVRSLEFFAPTSNDDITSQQTKLFFLISSFEIINLSSEIILLLSCTSNLIIFLVL